MSENNQKTKHSNAEKIKKELSKYESSRNLGLDADQSSENSGRWSNLNNDNDRVSHNPDGEDDNHDTRERPGYSPLMDK